MLYIYVQDFKTFFGISDTSIREHHTDGKVYFSGGGGAGCASNNNTGGLGGGGDGYTYMYINTCKLI